MPNLLLEIGTEEIPAGYIEPALEQMRASISEQLSEHLLSHGEIITAATPRRLTLFVEDIPERQEDRVVEVVGPPAKAAFDNEGNPTRAAEGFAKSQGVALASLVVKETKKGKYCVAVKEIEGRKTIELLPDILRKLIAAISFPKSMIWKEKSVRFARPVRSIVALFGEQVVPFEYAGVKSGRLTRGHPFLSQEPIELQCADFETYKKLLREQYVLVAPEERLKAIREQVMEILARHDAIFSHEELLREVANLVEYPCAIEGGFDEQFLKIPAPVIEAAMTEHQRYFPIRRKADGKLQPAFIVVSNRTEESNDIVREGNERVLMARLEDARFYYEEDMKRPLEKRLEELGQVLFLKGLGNYLEKTERLEKLADYIADRMGFEREIRRHAVRAARLCKADLVTHMVGEFPSLQGTIGGIYARENGEPEAVADAIAEHYRPRFVDDELPRTEAGLVVSIADKLDNMVSCFALGHIPTGSADPYALRRQASGIIRMLQTSGKSLCLRTALERAFDALPEAVREKAAPDTIDKLLNFIRDRLYQMCVERGYRYDIVNAVLSAGYADIADFFRRLEVISDLSRGEIWHDLVYLVQRSHNVMKIGEAAERVNPELFQQDEERALYKRYREKHSVIRIMLECKQYLGACKLYCEAFAEPVHEFFDRVFVNVKEEPIKRNRIRLIKDVNELFSRRIADLSQIVIEGDEKSS